MINEFKKFIMRGSVLDLAVAVVIGAAFGAIVKSLVDDIIMPILGIFTRGIDFSDLFVSLDGKTYPSLTAAKEAGAAAVAYGSFINAIITFLIIALAIFLLVRAVNRIMPPAAPVTGPTEDQKLLMEIRDLLKERARV